MTEGNNLAAVCMEILGASRAELCMALPYLSGPICALAPRHGDETTVSAATDGETLWYNAAYLATCYLGAAPSSTVSSCTWCCTVCSAIS